MFLARLARKGRMDRYRVVLLMQIFVRRVQVTGTGLDVVSMRDVRNRRDRRVLMGALELCVCGNGTLWFLGLGSWWLREGFLMGL